MTLQPELSCLRHLLEMERIPGLNGLTVAVPYERRRHRVPTSSTFLRAVAVAVAISVRVDIRAHHDPWFVGLSAVPLRSSDVNSVRPTTLDILKTVY
jgi:hypothetical protein